MMTFEKEKLYLEYVILPSDTSAARDSGTDINASAGHCYRHRIPYAVVIRCKRVRVLYALNE